MKKLIFILLFGSLFAQDVDTTAMGEMEKQMLFKQNDKSILLTTILASIPTAGHAYMGKWKRGLRTCSLLMAGGSTLVVGQIIFGSDPFSDNEKTWNATLGISILGGIILYPWYVLQAYDAVYLAKKHNADLYKQIYGRDYLIQPKKSVVQKMIDKKEAKKSNPL